MSHRRAYIRKHYNKPGSGNASCDRRTFADYEDTSHGRMRLAMSHGLQEDEKYERVFEEVTELTPEYVADMVAAGLWRKRQQDETEEVKQDRAELARLKKKLGE